MKKKICISLMAAFAVLLTVSAYFLISDKADEKQQTEKHESIAEVAEEPDTTLEPIQYTAEKSVFNCHIHSNIYKARMSEAPVNARIT